MAAPIAEPTSEPLDTHPSPYGYDRLHSLSAFGMHLRTRPIVKKVRSLRPATMLDLGCGYRADLLTLVAKDVPRAVGIDLEIDRAHAAANNIVAIEGDIVETLGTLDAESLACITMISVLEHLPNPQAALNAIHRVLAPGGTAIVHVPTWLGKPVLELAAYRLNIGTESIDDHRTYYRVAELWPMVITAGFRPMHTKMRYTILGFALRAELRKPAV
jgi:SAM-dependent methyltransferase